MERYGIAQKPCGIYAARQNGRVERAHRFLGDQLRVFRLEQNGSLFYWDEEAYQIAARLNGSFSFNVNTASNEMVFGFQVKTNMSQMELRSKT